ncbi:hypothetical protein F0L74_05950 [Chitinophaga agrisoli]|uniref:Uncharacterized protein n=1 Tax=Chitinophaga agrisoli TaxID=2607653 RepID=A0A5B2W5K3_9BACT|nr:hypothetical protein [Chitinophaga agrisoli]KAA2245499.1 hypothetical protein F0L74_05950 [Chitinophaga agrisoli]
MIVMAGAISAFWHIPFIAVAGVFLLLNFLPVPMPKGVANGLVLEHWASYIMERFYRDNTFLRFAYDDSQYADGTGRIIHIPQPGARPNVVKNRNQFPAVAVRRNDGDVLYALDEYTTDPTHIPNIDEVDLSYSKQDSVLGDHMEELDQVVADDMIIKWAINGTPFATTGGPQASQVSPVDGQVGNRFGFHHKDLAKLMVKANVDDVPKQDRYVLIDDNMFEFFYDSLSETMQRDFSKMVDAANGIVGKIHSWNVLTRSSVLAADEDSEIKALGAAIGPNDNLGCIAWQKNVVAFALGAKKLFQDTNNPLYFGDIHSALVMGGGRVRRQDGKGIYNIIQGKPAA